MASPNAPQIIIFFVISLLFTSLVVSWVLLQAYGISIAGLPFELPNNMGSVDVSQSSLFENNGWVYDGTGQIATSTDSYLLAKNSNYINAGGSYINSYQINNSHQLDYSIVLTYSSLQTQEVIVSNDGFTVVEHTIGVSDLLGTKTDYFYPYYGANQITNANIQTEFTPATSLKFTFNGVSLFDIGQTELGQFNTQSPVGVYFGGVGSKNNVGLGVNSFAVAGQENTTVGGIADLFTFATVLFKLLGWGIDPQYLPVELNLILIKSQEFAIGIGIIGLFWK